MKKIICQAVVLLGFVVASHSCTSSNTDQQKCLPCEDRSVQAVLDERIKWVSWLDQRLDIINALVEARQKSGTNFETMKEDWSTTISLLKMPEWAKTFE